MSAIFKVSLLKMQHDSVNESLFQKINEDDELMTSTPTINQQQPLVLTQQQRLAFEKVSYFCFKNLRNH